MIRSNSVLMNSGKLRKPVIRESGKRTGKNRKRCKPNIISIDTSEDNLMSLIDYSKLAKVSPPVLNYVLVDSGSHRLAV